MIRIGIDVGGTGIQFGALDNKMNILAEDSIPTNTSIPFSEQVERIAAAVVSTAEAAGCSPDSIESVVIKVRSGLVLILFLQFGFRNAGCIRPVNIRAFTNDIICLADILLNYLRECTASESMSAEIACMENAPLSCYLECTGFESRMVNDNRHNPERQNLERFSRSRRRARTYDFRS